MTAYVGADPEHLDQLATGFDQAADRLRAMVRDVEAQMKTMPWRGLDADDFFSRVATEVRPRVEASAHALATEAQTLHRNALEQREASRGDRASSGAAALGAGVPAAAGGLPPIPGDLVTRFETATPAERRVLWDQLDANTKDRFIAQHPALIGNADGIPFDDRYRANHLLVLRDYDVESKKNDTSDRTKMLSSLLDKQVVVYQPDQGRVATVDGNIDTAHHVAVFVPGTGSTFDTFPGGITGT